MTALNKQALREAAEKAIGAHERLSIMPSDDIFDISLHEGTQLDADITDLNVFNEAANPATVLALLDELEAANSLNKHLELAIRKAEGCSEALRRKTEAAEKRIAELEAGTVVVKQFDDFQIVHYGGSEDYAKGYIDCQNNYNKALTAAGIGVKGE
ncbi:ead/Ea22-like family protein [Citrobacter portucalensis]|uniref:ead/Ea22-like family protein n=1 Tax=Citrobacter portucalensis TaxID=1639133 RepID=UPI002DBFD7E4|nr:ead/Ea22-like family protein [Citrobacter portucalensis]MEB7914791.1 ead/Ea22-like family protein [Citrobacter portucalensis]